VTGPGPESGTYDTFVEFALKKIAEDRGVEDTTRSDYTASPNDNLIVDGIEGSDTSLGWVGFAFYEAEAEAMKAISIDGGEGCVAPSAETVADGSYPFSRSLYIYVSKKAIAENPAVASFVELFLSDEGIAKVAEAGYVSLPADRIEATRGAWASA
jgi:phosphate transport system substrate-binding protein